MGKKIKMRIDHSGLKYLFGQPTLSARKTRRFEFLNKYDFDFKHIKGKRNKTVDAFNRRVHEIHAKTISMCRAYLKDIILEVVTTN